MMVLAPKKRPWNHLLVLDLKMHCKVIDNINEPYCKPSFIRDIFILRLTVVCVNTFFCDLACVICDNVYLEYKNI